MTGSHDCKKIGFLALAVFLLAGCSGGPAMDKTPADQIVPSAQPLGRFQGQTSDQKTLASSLDCSGKNLTLDTRLSEGQVFKTRSEWLNQSGRFSDTGLVTSQITSVDFNQGFVREETSINYGNGEHDRFHQICRFDSQVSCQPYGMSNSSWVRFSKAQSATTQSDCTLTSDGKNDQHLSEVGSYSFTDGKTVPAIREIDQFHGSISCKKADGSAQPIGHGSQLTIQIASSQIPSLNSPSCGGATNVFVYDVIKADNGKILALKKYELSGLTL